MSSPKYILQVAAKAAIVNDKNQVLILRESNTGSNNTKSGYWGLVGGRLNPGESFFDALTREVLEETGLRIRPLHPLYVGEWRPTIHEVPHQIVAVFIKCKALSTKVKLSAEHDEFAWINPSQTGNYTFMDPDDLVIEALTTT